VPVLFTACVNVAIKAWVWCHRLRYSP
jgi:hypothetical protein